MTVSLQEKAIIWRGIIRNPRSISENIFAGLSAVVVEGTTHKQKHVE